MRSSEKYIPGTLVLLLIGCLSGCAGTDPIRLTDESAGGGEATQLVMTSASSSVLSGQCVPIRIALEDTQGVETVASDSESTSISLSADLGLFYDGPACLTAITAASVDPGSKFVWVYFKHDTAGTSPTLSASATLALPVSASLSLSLVASTEIGKKVQLAVLTASIARSDIWRRC